MRQANSPMASRVRASASGAKRPVASTPCPSRVRRRSRSSSAKPRAASARSAISRRTELVPQSTAATRVAAAAPGTGGPEGAQGVQHLVAEQVHPASGGRASTAARTCRHLTRSGMPPALMPVRFRHLPEGRAVGEVGLVGAVVRRRRLRLLLQPERHLGHQPGRLQRRGEHAATARAGQVVGRRERGAVGQPRLGGHRARPAARAAPGHPGDAPRARPGAARRRSRRRPSSSARSGSRRPM